MKEFFRFVMRTIIGGALLLTVFVPSAATLTAGSVYYLTERQIRRLDIPVSTAMKCIMQLGVGSREWLDRLERTTGAGE